MIHRGAPLLKAGMVIRPVKLNDNSFYKVVVFFSYRISSQLRKTLQLTQRSQGKQRKLPTMKLKELTMWMFVHDIYFLCHQPGLTAVDISLNF